MFCLVCQKETAAVHGAGRPRKYCSSACRQRAYRRRREHLEHPRRAAQAGQSGLPGSVVALVVLPAAMASAVDQLDIHPVWDLGDFLVGLARARSDLAQAPEPTVPIPPEAGDER